MKNSWKLLRQLASVAYFYCCGRVYIHIFYFILKCNLLLISPFSILIMFTIPWDMVEGKLFLSRRSSQSCAFSTFLYCSFFSFSLFILKYAGLYVMASTLDVRFLFRSMQWNHLAWSDSHSSSIWFAQITKPNAQYDKRMSAFRSPWIVANMWEIWRMLHSSVDNNTNNNHSNHNNILCFLRTFHSL